MIKSVEKIHTRLNCMQMFKRNSNFFSTHTEFRNPNSLTFPSFPLLLLRHITACTSSFSGSRLTLQMLQSVSGYLENYLTCPGFKLFPDWLLFGFTDCFPCYSRKSVLFIFGFRPQIVVDDWGSKDWRCIYLRMSFSVEFHERMFAILLTAALYVSFVAL